MSIKNFYSMLLRSSLFVFLYSLYFGSFLYAATISGTVMDSGGNPIAGSGGSGGGAYVLVGAFYGETCGFHWPAGDHGWIKSDGTYEITNLPEGTYYLRAYNYSYGSPHNDYVTEWWASLNSVVDCNDAMSITLDSTDSLINMDFQLNSGAITIEGTVMDSGGAAIAGTGTGINVIAFSGEPCGFLQYWTQFSLDAFGTGFYYLSGLPPGESYYVRAINGTGATPYVSEWYNFSGGEINCRNAEPITGNSANIDFYLDSGAATISGTVRDSSGTPITGDSVGVNAFFGEPCGNLCYLTVCWTNPTDGTYLISGLPPESPSTTYYLQTGDSWQDIYMREWWAFSGSVIDCTFAEGITISPGGSETGKDFHLDSGAATISGTVRDSGGTPITGISLLIWADKAKYPGLLKVDGSAWSNPSDGTYVISGLSAGTYYLCHSNFLGNPYMNEWWASSGSVTDWSLAEGITISPGGLETGKDFHLDSGAITISGTVKDSVGNPIERHPTGVVAYSSKYCAGVEDPPLLSASGSNYFDGSYLISGIPNGSYYLLAWDSSSQPSYIAEWWAATGSVTDCSLAESVTGSSTGIDFFLDDPAGMISGTVKDHLDNPITGNYILVGAFSGNPDACGDIKAFGGWVTNLYSRDGTYKIVVPSGDYYLKAYDTDGYYTSEWWASPESVVDCAAAQVVTIDVGGSESGKDFKLGVGSIDDILDFFDESVADGTLRGIGCGWFAELRLWFFRKMLVLAGEYIEEDKSVFACFMLERCYLRCDGQKKPADFVKGEATENLSEMIYDLSESLGCEWIENGL